MVAEFLSFPNGRHDDIVDAVCMGIAVLRESTAPAQAQMQFVPLSVFANNKEQSALERDAGGQLIRSKQRLAAADAF